MRLLLYKGKGTNPQLSPSGEFVAFEKKGKVVVVDPFSKEEKDLGIGSGPLWVDDEHVSVLWPTKKERVTVSLSGKLKNMGLAMTYQNETFEDPENGEMRFVDSPITAVRVLTQEIAEKVYVWVESVEEGKRE